MSFQAITNFLLNSNSVNLQDNLINLQSDDFNNSKISNYSLSKTESFSDVLASFSSSEKFSSKNSEIVSNKTIDSSKNETVNDPKVSDSQDITNEKQNIQNDDVEEPKKIETKEDSKDKVIDKEKTAEKKDELKNDSLDTNLFVSKNAEIPATKNENLQKGNKISANDFSKIQELGEVVSQNQNANEISESIDFKNADTILKNDKKIKELAGENLENSDFVFANNSEEVSNLSLGEKSFDNSNFNFKNQNQNNSKNESKISIKDLRTEISEELNLSENSEVKVTDVKVDQNQSATVTMELVQNNQTAQNNILSLNSQAASSNGSNFQAMLNNQIQANIPEFVKTGSIILKDNNQGNINLILNPEELGNVKISLALDGKSISGQITVVSKEALEVFKDNAETLREAFIKSGFENASIDISFADNGSFGNETQNYEEFTKEHQKFAVNKTYGGVVDSEIFEESEKFENFSNNSVNIVA